MAVLGVGITVESKLAGNTTAYVEYHRCDRCGTEFRLYFKTEKDLKETLEQIRNIEKGREIACKGREDLCHSCMSRVPADQLVLML